MPTVCQALCRALPVKQEENDFSLLVVVDPSTSRKWGSQDYESRQVGLEGSLRLQVTAEKSPPSMTTQCNSE